MTTTVMTLGTLLHCDKTLIGILFLVTFTQGQGPQVLYNIFNKIKDRHFLRHYDHYSHETWHKGTM